MLALVERQLKLYFYSKSTVFFSLLGAMISFVLYIVFLQKNITEVWPDKPHVKWVLDWWVIGGTLAVTGITTSWSVILRLILDKETHRLDDFLLTDISLIKVYYSYFMSSTLIASMMQLVMFGVMMGYFYIQDHLVFSIQKLGYLIMLAILSSMVSAVLSLLVSYFIHRIEIGERLSVIIGTLSGFLVGVYMPIGTLPDFALKVIKFVPGLYVSSAYRQLLIDSGINQLSLPGKDIEEYLGVGIKWEKLTSLSDNVILLSLVFLIAFSVLSLKIYYDEKVIHGFRKLG